MRQKKETSAKRKTTQKQLQKKITTKNISKTHTKVSKKKEKDEQQQQVEQRPNEERFYCKNVNLMREMLKWKNSTKEGLPVYKKVGSKLVKTETGINEDYQHEQYKRGTKYYVQFKKNNPRYKLLEERNLLDNLVRQKGYFVEDVTKIVEHQGYAFDIDEDEQHRTISEVLGLMMMQIAEKVSNHSFFRNYNQWDKAEMQSYAYEKIIRGLPNYSFKFTNVFAYFTQACFNSFKSILSKHYKQINIKRDMAKKAMVDLQTNLPGSSMERCLGNQFRGNDYDNFSEF